MRNILTTLLLLVSFSLNAQTHKSIFNFDWKFLLASDNSYNQFEDAKYAAIDYDDSQWRKLDLPHDFQFELPWNQDASRARGFKNCAEGWYRKTFKAESSWKGKLVSVEFGGIMYYSDVYINGHKVASQEYGYVGFEADLTPYLDFDKDNVLAVYASTSKSNGARWYTGGGIYRDVNLIVTDSVHVYRNGLFVSTPEVSEERATIQLQIEVDGFQGHEVSLKANIISPKGEIVGTCSADVNTRTHHTRDEILLPIIEINNPLLWSCETPELYTAEVIVISDGEEVDKVNDTFGIRWIEFSTNEGFKLNGKKIFLKGVANHHDMGAVGAASYDRSIERMMLKLKEFGFNSIRCSHNPYSDSFCRIADRLGILIVDELIDKWSDEHCWGGRKSWIEHEWYHAIPEWIKRDRNRPSVIMWSLGNELQYEEVCAGFQNFNDFGVTTYKIYDQLVKKYDNSRKTTVAQYPSRKGAIRWNEPGFYDYRCPPELAFVTEITSINYQVGDYKYFYEFIPDMILYQSEATTNDLLGPYYGMDRDRGVGLAYWGAIEYWGESDGWPKKGWNYSFFQHTLEPNPQAYLIKSAFVPNEPLVHIGIAQGSENIIWNDINVGQVRYKESWNCKKGSYQDIATFANTEEVELRINGRRIGRKKSNTETDNRRRNVLIWENVKYERGYIEAIGYNQGKEVTRHKIESSGEAISLKIETENPNDWKADGLDLQYIKVYAVDECGRVVKDFEQPLSVSLEGESAYILATDNGDHYTDLISLDTKNPKPMKDGFMQIILRSTKTKGVVTLIVKSEKLSARHTLRLQ